MNSRLRHTTAAAVVLAALGTALVPLSATATAAPAASPAGTAELVIPAQTRANPHQDSGVGTNSGFLRADHEAYVWTKYGEKTGTRLTNLPKGVVRAAGAETLAFVDTRTVTFRDMRDGSTSVITLPEGHSFVGNRREPVVSGEAVLTKTGSAEGTRLHWLTLENGRLKDLEVTGLPAGEVSVYGINTHGALVSVKGASRWVDRSGTVRTAPWGTVVGDWLLAGEYVPGVVKLQAVKAWDTRGSLAEQDAKRVPYESTTLNWKIYGVVGGDLLMSEGGKLQALPLDGSPPRVLTDKETSPPTAVQDGRLVTGLKGPGTQRTVQTVERGADGRAVLVQRADLPPVTVEIGGLAMDNGRLYSTDAYPNLPDVPKLTEYSLPAGGAPQTGPRRDRGQIVGNCNLSGTQERRPCTPLVPVGDGRLVYGEGDHFLHVSHPSGKNFGTMYLPPAVGGVQASGRFVAYADPKDAVGPVTVYDLDRRKAVRTLPGSGTTFALSGAWVWREKPGAGGELEAVDVRDGKVVRTAKVADCDVKVLEAWASSVYWKCDGASGVYDTGTRANVPLPAHNTARLGDGFVAWEKDGSVKITDLRGATGTRDIGKPANPVPGTGWTVDRYSGRIAWRDAAHAIHVVNAAVAGSSIAAIDRDTPGSFDPVVGTKTWSGAWFLNKTASSWTLTIREKTGGAVVRTITGGEARATVRTTWDGKDGAGRLVPNGAYAWTLSGKPADGQGPDLNSTGVLNVIDAGGPRRDFLGKDGHGDLVSLDEKNRLGFHRSPGYPGFEVPQTSPGWPSTSTFVPFGDLNGDGCGDILVRNAAGELRSYHPACGTIVTTSTPSKPLGTGWGQYDVLTFPGDVTGDRRPDLVARQASTGDLYLYAADGAGAFKPRVKLAGNFKQYPQLFGTGDVNRDGSGDLMAVDGANTLWRFDGAGNGTFKPRVQVNGTGWANGRTLFIGVGDLNGDLIPDLVSRNAKGELFFNKGNGSGGLLATGKIAAQLGSRKLF
ncbi:FG-GAP-like repeat-containing protein [Streptomyces sp. NPDC089799]|uniref:FG-GAP-like repeat-containing protein n=1 Tax=Streptomyces sp. NPDC089799 TaxID=3155066 RepID=UPI00341D7863